MERNVDPAEMKLRRDLDFIASLRMVGEGAPVFTDMTKREPAVNKPEENEKPQGFNEEELPRDYQ